MAQWRPALLYLHPLSAPLILVEAAFGLVAPWQVLYGLVYSAAWVAFLSIWSRRTFRRWLIERAEGAGS
jgi:fluoroquinolone transport system permease protein